MNKGKAIAILKDINNAECTDNEIAHAIYLVMNMPTHMSITKDDLINAIKWLWHSAYEYKEDVEEKAGDMK